MDLEFGCINSWPWKTPGGGYREMRFFYNIYLEYLYNKTISQAAATPTPVFFLGQNGEPDVSEKINALVMSY